MFLLGLYLCLWISLNSLTVSLSYLQYLISTGMF